MTHPFDEIAVEAAAKAIDEVVGPDLRRLANAALSAAFKSARERRMVWPGCVWYDGETGLPLIEVGPPSQVAPTSVTIIRHKGE